MTSAWLRGAINFVPGTEAEDEQVMTSLTRLGGEHCSMTSTPLRRFVLDDVTGVSAVAASRSSVGTAWALHSEGQNRVLSPPHVEEFRLSNPTPRGVRLARAQLNCCTELANYGSVLAIPRRDIFYPVLAVPTHAYPVYRG